MIDKNNFTALLEHLGFEKPDIFSGIFTKKYQNGYSLSADFTKERLQYPESLKINEQQTCNFSQAENAVVFECVDRLLTKGYHPEHLELEPRWQVGRGASGGRADILVRNQQNQPILIIECKTAGTEYDKEKRKMETHGGQLFGYLVQDRNVRYLCLYASQWANEQLTYQNAIVKIEDKAEDIKAYDNGDKSIKLYRNAKPKEELFAVWKETHNLYFHFNGIFEYDINAYEIELKPLKKKDLKTFTEATSIFNLFMEILRHNNISDNANAFNRLLSLFLCKIVDEERGDDEVLDFQVKEGEDTPERIQDRLQKLYAKGMKEHLGEEIVYYEDSVIEKIVSKYPRQTPIENVKKIFKRIKYYTQNEFAIKEVHNEELFIQNARVLNELIRLLQNYQFRYTKKQQILGDFFELILNHGVKQSEGQFFTPVPLVRFIILSLGLDRIAQQKISKGKKSLAPKSLLPKILDYACGSGHFLTESIDELQKFIENLDLSNIDNKVSQPLKQYKESTEWAKNYIFGIEKDYRLARTAQISCFLNGDGDANIIFGDGLENHPRLQLKEKFDVIIANPPYAVKSFKNYLNVGQKEFTLFQDLSENSGEIECLFVERTSQLLKTGGKAGIILPSSILSNNSNLHQNTRSLLLAHFLIKGIAEFGSGTFGATGTNTVVLFLEKRSKDFEKDRRYISEDLFNGVKRKRKLEHIDSAMLLRKFIGYRGFNEEDYKSLMQKNANDAIRQSEFWQEYQNWLLDSDSKYKKLTQIGKQNEIEKYFYEKILKIEEKKFYNYMLTLDDEHRSQPVIISHSGEKNVAKQFLGYEFSNRRGAEGIKITRNEQGSAINKMYDDTNHTNPCKVNSYMLKNFYNESITQIDESLKEHVKTAFLTDMLDFSQNDFNNAISLNPKKNNIIETKWELVKLGDVVNLKAGGTPSRKQPKYWNGTIKWLKINDFKDFDQIYDTGEKITKQGLNNSAAKMLYKDTVVVSIFATIGRVGILKENMTTNQAIVGLIIKDKQNLLEYYLMIIVKYCSKQLENEAIGMAQPNINSTKLSNLKIPLPPTDIQKKIVKECEAIDNQVGKAQDNIDKATIEIDNEMKEVFEKNFIEKTLEELAKEMFAGGDVPKDNFSEVKTEDYNIPIYANGTSNKGLYGYTDTPRVSEPCITISARGTLGYTEVRKEPFVPIVRLIVIIPNASVNVDYLKYVVSKLNFIDTGAIIPQLTVPKIKGLQIPVPPISKQKELVAKIEKLEASIHQAQQTITDAPEKKKQILDKYLK